MNKKAVLKLGYTEIVMDMDVALELFTKLNSTTCYQKGCDWPKDDNGKQYEVKYVLPFNESVSVFGMSDEDFAVMKLAGESKK